MKNWLMKHLTGYTFWVIAAFLGFFTMLYTMHLIDPGFAAASLGAKTLDMRFGYGPTEAYTLFSTLGADGRGIYVNLLFVDFVFIASFALVQDFLLRCAMGKAVRQTPLRLLLAFAFLRCACDVLENISILFMISRFPAQLPWLATLSGFLTQLKFIFLYLWLGAIPVALIARIVLKGRRQHA